MGCRGLACYPLPTKRTWVCSSSRSHCGPSVARRKVVRDNAFLADNNQRFVAEVEAIEL